MTLLLCVTALALAWMARNQELALAVRVTLDLPTSSTNRFTIDFTPLTKPK